MQNWIFGYGSLVNAKTRKNDADTVKVELRGWRRAWRHIAELDGEQFCGLTIEPDETKNIFGVLIRAEAAHFEEIDERERNYRRFQLKEDICVAEDRPARDLSFNNCCHAYETLESHALGETHDVPILQSYLDVVLDGFLDGFGEEGLLNFLTTTDGFDAPILNDRKAPLYPRALKIDLSRLEKFDKLVSGRREGPVIEGIKDD